MAALALALEAASADSALFSCPATLPEELEVAVAEVEADAEAAVAAEVATAEVSGAAARALRCCSCVSFVAAASEALKRATLGSYPKVDGGALANAEAPTSTGEILLQLMELPVLLPFGVDCCGGT